MTAAFGAPTPLPGQPGFRSRPSEAMARETTEMEERLSRLKTDLTTEAEMREAAGPRVGGSRWRSARTDRGSVRAYAKDVKVRHQQQLQQHPPHGVFTTGGMGSGRQTKTQAGAGARAAAALRDEQQQQQQQQQQERHRRQVQKEKRRDDLAASSPLSSASHRRSSAPLGSAGKEVSTWSVDDTLEWLDGLGLGTHCGVFQQNEISGPILLEVGLDDLDYMNVHVLAHRKQILKGIEELRGGGDSSNADVPPPPAPVEESGSGSDGSRTCSNRERGAAAVGNQDRCRQGGDRQSSGKPKRKHWSRVKPLSENQVEEIEGGSGGSASERLADGTYDEAVAHSSFADAVAEWRGQKGEKMAPPISSSPRAVGRAPVAGIETPEPYFTARDPRRRGQVKVGGLLGGSSSSACWTNPFASPRSTGHEAGTEFEVSPEIKLISPPGRAKAALPHVGKEQRVTEDCTSTLDEEAEHAAFRRAVGEWNREGGKHAREDSGCSVRDTTLASTPRFKAEEMAEALREQMDEEHRMQAQELEERKKALLQGLDTARRENSDGKQGFGAEAKDSDSMPFTGNSRGNFEGDAPNWGETAWEKAARREAKEEEGEMGKEGEEEEPWEQGVSGGSSSTSSSGPCVRSSSHGEDSWAGNVGFNAREERGSLEIELVESVLGAGLSIEDRTCYLVDEGESSESSGL